MIDCIDRVHYVGRMPELASASTIHRRSSLLVALLAGCAATPSPGPSRPAVEPLAAPVGTATAAPCSWALGWAGTTGGGAGGAIVRVTTLAAQGPGSLAEALARPGPRQVVFEVGGVIDLELSTLRIEEPFVTVAGQTAPSPGITLIRGSIKVATHDVVLQHLRVRPGAAAQPKGEGWEPDGISSSGAHHLVVDHCSISWAVDENLSASGERFKGETPDEWRDNTSHHVTFSHNLIAEGLSQSTHKKGEHSKGSLIHDNVTHALVFANLYASNVERNPFFKGGARGAVVNNWLVNPAKYAMKYTLVEAEWGEHPHEVGQMSVVGNVFHYGPQTPPGTPLLFASGVGRCDVHLADNVTRDRAGKPAPLLGGQTQLFIEQRQRPTWPDGLQALPAADVVAYLQKEVGARPWERDAVDQRIVTQALASTSAIIDSEEQVGGYPAAGPPTRAAFYEKDWDLTCMVRRAAQAK